MYLIMANQIGITGVVIFLTAMVAVLAYGWRAWRRIPQDTAHASLHLGLHLALLTALINAFADLYFFRLDFQSPITWFWLIVGLCIASTTLADGYGAGANRSPALTNT